MFKRIYVLEYSFHLLNLNYEEIKVEPRISYFHKFEDMLKVYREKKTALFMNAILYNTDFKVYSADLEEINIENINKMLEM